MGSWFSRRTEVNEEDVHGGLLYFYNEEEEIDQRWVKTSFILKSNVLSLAAAGFSLKLTLNADYNKRLIYGEENLHAGGIFLNVCMPHVFQETQSRVVAYPRYGALQTYIRRCFGLDNNYFFFRFRDRLTISKFIAALAKYQETEYSNRQCNHEIQELMDEFKNAAYEENEREDANEQQLSGSDQGDSGER